MRWSKNAYLLIRVEFSAKFLKIKAAVIRILIETGLKGVIGGGLGVSFSSKEKIKVLNLSHILINEKKRILTT